jgi:hypothetical protein
MTNAERWRLAAEIEERGLEWECRRPFLDDDWVDSEAESLGYIVYAGWDIRIKPKPDRWAELRAKKEARPEMVIECWSEIRKDWFSVDNPTFHPAHQWREQPWWRERKAKAEGKKIEVKITSECFPAGQWIPKASPDWFECGEYRIAPEPKMIPLESKDVPVGSLVKLAGWGSDAYAYPSVYSCGICFIGPNGWLHTRGWEAAMKDVMIKRPGEDWMKCEKPEG